MANYKKVLLCVDYSDESIKALDKAISLTKSFDAEFHICHVVSPIAAVPVHGYYYPLSIDLEKKVLLEAENKMKDITSNLPIEKSNIHVFFGDPKESIVSFSKEKNIDLVMVVGHHHSFIGMLGSTANYVTNKIHCDVLIINS